MGPGCHAEGDFVNERVFRVVDRLDRPWAVRIGRDGTPTILVRRGEVLPPTLLRWLLGVVAQLPTQQHGATPAPTPAERLVCDIAGGAACATLPRVALAELWERHHVVLTVHTDTGPLTIGMLPAANLPPAIGDDEPAAPPRPRPVVTVPSPAGRQHVRAGHRTALRWVAVAALAVGSLWVADTFDDAPTDGRYGVAEDARMEAVTVVTHAPPQTWPGITAY